MSFVDEGVQEYDDRKKQSLPDDSTKDEQTNYHKKAIKRLSKLSELDYEIVKQKEAKKLGFRSTVLDDLVGKSKADFELRANDDVVTKDKAYQGNVNGDLVVCEIEKIIKKYVILPKGALHAVSLWIATTYVYDVFRIYPKLAVISPEKRCGKSLLLEILSALCCSELSCSNITPAAIFRIIDLYKPTLIIDEADTFLRNRNDEMIGIINSGHSKDKAKVIRLDGDNLTP